MTSKHPTPLRQAIASKGLTHKELAARLGLNDSQISRYANGLIPPKRYQGRIARALGTTKADLWPHLDGRN